MAIIKAENKKKEPSKKKKLTASLEAQEKLVSILNDTPSLVSLQGTEFELRALKMGTQYLIAQEVIKIKKNEDATYVDIIQQFAVNIPSLVKVIVLCLLNDKNRIYKDGVEYKGFSDEYTALYDTIMWEGNIEEYGNVLFECLQLLDVTVFFQTLDILSVFKENITMKREKMREQK